MTLAAPRPVPFLLTFDIHARENLELEWNTCLDVLATLGLRATFFLPGIYVRERPLAPTLRRLVGEGHQLACHGLLHRSPEDFSAAPLETQIAYIRRATDLLEQAAQTPVTAFRGPGFCVSPSTLLALEHCGYRADLSVNPQRLGPLSTQVGNVGWLTAPRRPYHPRRTNPYRPGDLALWEIPTTACILPFTSMVYQYLGLGFTRWFSRGLFAEARIRRTPLVYMGHPEEFFPSRTVHPRLRLKWHLFYPRKGSGFRARHLLQERDEHRIYQRNREMIRFLCAQEDFQFLTVNEYLDRREGRAEGHVPGHAPGPPDSTSERLPPAEWARGAPPVVRAKR